MDRKGFLRELKEEKKKNYEQNLKFISLYVKYLKSKSNKEWSMEQKKFIDSIYSSLPRKVIISKASN